MYFWGFGMLVVVLVCFVLLMFAVLMGLDIFHCISWGCFVSLGFLGFLLFFCFHYVFG